MPNDVMLSICCLTYNHRPFIRETLDSFLSQKTVYKFEILVHDDASTDGTTEILREYESRFPEIVRVFYEDANQYANLCGHGKYRGGYTRGLLIPNAKGKYVATCEGDDYWCVNYKIQRQIDYLELHSECVGVCHSSYVVDGVGGRNLGVMGMGDRAHDLSVNEVIEQWAIPTSSCVFRTDYNNGFLESLGSYMPVGDFPYSVYLASKGAVHYDPTPMSVYRFRVPGSWTFRSTGFSAAKEKADREWLAMLDTINEATDFEYEESLVKNGKRKIVQIYKMTGSVDASTSVGKAAFAVLSGSERMLMRALRVLWRMGFDVVRVGWSPSRQWRICKR